MKVAVADRDRHVSDPDFNNVPIEQMLSSTTHDAHARSIDPARARACPHDKAAEMSQLLTRH
jgi:gamma-glutamyltranspeptidase/glutathione hydrolase